MNKFLVILLFCLGCASVTPPDGGPRDETPPKVVSTYPDSAQTLVSPHYLRFTFDEYVKTQDIQNLLILSPSTETFPKTEIKKKSFFLYFKDSLKTKTTYTLSFNGAILDINEGNPLDDYRFCFSTGDYIDSMEYHAVVINAYTRKICKECLVSLYAEQNDSLIILSKPDYLGKTDNSGRVSIKNLPDKNFHAIALKDNNKNLRLDDKELVSLFREIKTDTISVEDTFFVSPYYIKTRLQPKLAQGSFPGIIRILFDRPVYTNKILLRRDSGVISHTFNYTKDTLSAYISYPFPDTITLKLEIDTSTYFLKYRHHKVDSLFKIPSVKLLNKNSLQINSPQLIREYQANKISLFADSNKLIIKEYLVEKNKLVLQSDGDIQDKSITLKLEAGAISNINNSINSKDSFMLSYRDTEKCNLRLNIEISNDHGYLIEMLKNDQIIRIDSFREDYIKDYTDLEPGTYRFRIITDINHNMIWDPVDMFNRKEAEPIFMSENVELRPNWDKELIISDL